MQGGIDHRESSIRSKPKQSADLDHLRDEVKNLESSLHKAATKRAQRSENLQHESRQLINARRDYNLQNMMTMQNLRNMSTLLPPLQHSGREKSPVPSPYSYQDAFSKREKLRYDVLAAQQEDSRAGAIGNSNNLNLVVRSVDRENENLVVLNPLPMVSDSVFRDGMVSVLISEGWTGDQALASVIATQGEGTLAAARTWLKTVLKTGKSSPRKMKTSPMRNISPGRQQQQQQNFAPETSLRHRVTGTGGFEASGRRSLPESSFNQRPVQSTTNESHSEWQRQTMQSQQNLFSTMLSTTNNTNNMCDTFGRSTTMTSREMREEVLPMTAHTQVPLLPPRTSGRRNSSVAIERDVGDHQTTTSSSLPPIYSHNVSQQQQYHQSMGIRIKMRRPTDGKTIELRRRFESSDLLSTVVMAFLSEQGEDATSNSSREESEKAASFARQVSSSASKWAVVSMVPPKKAYDWTAMDRTTLEEAGVGVLGGSFQMVQLQHVKSTWKEK